MADFKNIINIVEEYDDGQIDEWTPAEQVADCCQEIPGADECTDEGKVEVWNGQPQAEDNWNPEEIYNWFKAQNPGYGDRLIGYTVESVGGPEDGGPCGEQYTTWEGSLSCCDIVYPMSWADSTFSHSVTRDNQYTYTVNGGTLPYSFSTVGYGLSIVGGDAVSVRVEVNICMCNPALILVTDACGQQLIKMLYLSDGSWGSATDTYYQSDYGWYQGGGVTRCTGGAVTIHGFNDDRTMHSQQLYGQICYTKATPAETDETAIAALCAVGLAQGDYGASGAVSAPGSNEGYTKCDSGNVWYKNVDDDPNFGTVNFHAFYQTTSGSTQEYTPGTCEDELLIDEDESGTVIADDSSMIVEWYGGVPPYSIALHGVEIYLDSDKTTTQLYSYNLTSIRIYSGDTCGSSWGTVTDSCGTSVTHHFKSTEGEYQIVWSTGRLAPDFEGSCYYTDHIPELINVGSLSGTQSDPNNDDLPWYAGAYTMNSALNVVDSSVPPKYLADSPVQMLIVGNFGSPFEICTEDLATYDPVVTDTYLGIFEWVGVDPIGNLIADPACESGYKKWTAASIPFQGATAGLQIFEWIC